MKPKIRPLDVHPVGENFWIRDPLMFSEGVVVSYPALLLMSLMDGSRDLGDIKAEFFRATGYILKDEELSEFIHILDRALLLDNQAYKQALKEEIDRFIQKGVRPMSHVGEVYPENPQACRDFLCGTQKEKREVLGLMVPHMDIRVAKDTYWEGYGRLREDKRLILILGVSHYWHEMPFSALPVDMETPFGMLKTNKSLIEKLQSSYDFDITHDILSYRTEHSIEFASLYAKMLFPEAEALALIVSYGDIGFLKGLAENLLRVIDKDLKHTLIISSVDLSHVGRKFGDEKSYDPSASDKTYLSMLEELKVEESFEFLNRSGNPTRIDGQYTNLVFSHILRTAGLQKGELFDYRSYYEESTDSIVSYASMGF